MDQNSSENRKDRVGFLKKLIIAVLVILLIFPNIVGVILLIRQARMQSEIDALAREMANMHIGSLGGNGRLNGEGRLAILEAYPEYFDDDILMAADMEAVTEPEDRHFPGNDAEDVISDDVVWSFSSSGEVSEATHKVYLTFDDGPSEYTDDILDILDEYGVKATFFVVGKEKDSDLELYKRIVDEGHTLGMHSYSHVYSRIYSSEDSFISDLDRISDLLTGATGQVPQFYRFPGGSSNAVSPLDMHKFINILDERGITYFDWNVSSGDATNELLSAKQITYNATAGIEKKETSVILMHDSLVRPTTVEALPAIIEKILSIDGAKILPITSDTEAVKHIE